MKNGEPEDKSSAENLAPSAERFFAENPDDKALDQALAATEAERDRQSLVGDLSAVKV